MFRVLTKDGKRISSKSGNTEDLIARSRLKQLICPYCKEDMQFVNSKEKRPYFRHLVAECTYQYHDSESEEHEQGKELIYERLKELYPHSTISYEKRVKETNQIADVMVTHPDGSRWAFEFQCYLLSDSEWNIRHNLYKKAKIVDFWVFGDIAVHNYAEGSNLSAKNFHKLKAMESAVWDSGSPLYYLNTETEKLCIIDEGKYYSDRVLNGFESEDNFAEAFIIEYQWYSPTRLKKVEARRLELLKLQERQQLAEEERRRKLLAWEKKQRVTEKEKEQHLATLIDQRDHFTEDFTQKEKELFLRLIKNHGYNRETFPGLLQLEVNYSELIETPVQLWQLWIYDQNIAGRVSKSLKTPFINTAYILEGFKKLKNDGYIRLAWNPSQESNYTFAIYDFLKILCNVGVLERMGFSGAKKYKVLVDKIPHYEERLTNIQQKLIIEDESTAKTFSESYQSDPDYSKLDYSNSRYFTNNDSIRKFQSDIYKIHIEANKIIAQANFPTPLSRETKEKIAYDLIAQAKRKVAYIADKSHPEIDNWTRESEEKKLNDDELRMQIQAQRNEENQRRLIAQKNKQLAIENDRLEMLRLRSEGKLFKLTARPGLFDGLEVKTLEFFKALCAKHKFSDVGYPSIFDQEVACQLIDTPNRVWQLWFYDRQIYRRNESEIFNMTAIHEYKFKKPQYDFLMLRRDGVFQTSGGDYFRESLYQYKDILVKWGIVEQVEVRDYKVLVNEIPILKDKGNN